MTANDEKVKKENIIDNPLLFYYIFAVMLSIVSAIIFTIIFILCYKKRNALEDDQDYDIYKETKACARDKKSNRLLKKDGRPKKLTLKGNKPNPYGFDRADPVDMPDYKCPCHIKGGREHDPSKPYHAGVGGPSTYLVQDINKVFAIARKKRLKNPYDPNAVNPFMNVHMKNCRYKHTATYLNTCEGSKMDPSMIRCEECNAQIPEYENEFGEPETKEKAKKKKKKESKSGKKKDGSKKKEETKLQKQESQLPASLQRDKSFCPYDSRVLPNVPPLFPPRQSSKFVNYNVDDSTTTNYNKKDYQLAGSRKQSTQMSVNVPSCQNCQRTNYSYMNCQFHSSINQNVDDNDPYTSQRYSTTNPTYSKIQSSLTGPCCKSCRPPFKSNTFNKL